ncbi:uncharacterized protein EI97DRAFT_470965 [Westerdykella ornata]|uniref:Chromo domain-containing protein n=1 Tax=Westerdykella ornata TaxID=318751 RepID=A0A6A6J7U2_WESOR|nr:uncharacterized protein EI97DRAFT_470965 [Westerdykella ornata]KAF2271696.1 hypothetical protein EI97DRAFT_470965 [Westerdykella ornata]
MADNMADNNDEEAVWVVEDILAEMTTDEDGKKYYLVKWEGYPWHEDTWEPPENFIGNSLEYWEQRKKELGGEGSRRLNRYIQKNIEKFERALDAHEAGEAANAEPAFESERRKADSPPSASGEPRSLFVPESQKRRNRPLVQSSSSESSSGEEEETLASAYRKRKRSTTARQTEPGDGRSSDVLETTNSRSTAPRRTDQASKPSGIAPASPLVHNNPPTLQSGSDSNQKNLSNGRINIVNKPTAKRVWKKGDVAFRTLKMRHAFQKFKARELPPDFGALQFPLEQPVAVAKPTAETLETGRHDVQPARMPTQQRDSRDDNPYGRRDYGRRREDDAEERPSVEQRIARSHKVPLICLDWRSGHCDHSDDACRYWHENMPGMEVSQFGKGVPPKYRDPPLTCYYYMATEKGCNKPANECGYAHENTGWLAAKDGGEPKQIDKNMLPLRETSQRITNSKLKPKDREPPITCWFYMIGPMGCDKSADRCLYAHWNTGLLGMTDKSIVEIPKTQLPRFQPPLRPAAERGTVPSPSTPGLVRRPSWKDPGAKTCHFWFHHGHCSKPAAQCKFRHAYNEGDEVAEPPGSKRLQALWMQEEGAIPDNPNTIPLGSPSMDDNTESTSRLESKFGNNGLKTMDESISPLDATNGASFMGQPDPSNSAIEQSRLKAVEISRRIATTETRSGPTVSTPSPPFAVQSPPSIEQSPPPHSPLSPPPPLSGPLQIGCQAPPNFFSSLHRVTSAATTLRGSESADAAPAMISTPLSNGPRVQSPATLAAPLISCSAMKSVIEKACNLDFTTLFTNRIDQSVCLDRKALLMFHPTEQVEEMELVRRWLLMHHVEVYTLDVEGSWDYFKRKLDEGGSGIIIAPPQFDRYWAIPGFGQALRGNKLRVWSHGCQSPLDYDSLFVDRVDPTKYECEEVFPLGGIIFITDDVLENAPSQALDILNLFITKVNKCRNETDSSVPWDYKNYSSLFWRLAVRPDLIQSAFDRVDALEAESLGNSNSLAWERASLLAHFADLAELNFMDHVQPSYIPRLVDLRPILSEPADQSQAYFAALSSSPTGAIDQQVEYWAKKVCAMRKSYRHFFVVHTEPSSEQSAEWQRKFCNIDEVITPEKCIELLKEDSEGSRIDFMEWYLPKVGMGEVQEAEANGAGDPMDISSSP